MRYWLVVAMLALVQLTGAPPARAETRIDEVVVTNSSHDLLLYFQLRNAITPEMEQGLKSGLPLTFTFFVELHRQRTGWLDQHILSSEFNHRLNYDSLKDEYHVVREEEGGTVLTATSLAEANQLMTRVNGLVLLPLDQLVPGHSYTLRVRARLAEKSRPLSFHRLLPLRRLWSFETAWHNVEFHY